MNPNPSPATRFKPGNRANPGGRPKGPDLTARLRAALAEPIGDGGRPAGMTVADRLVEALIEMAIRGDRQAIKDIFERVDGKAPDRVFLDDAWTSKPCLFIPDDDRYSAAEQHEAGRPPEV